MPRSRIKELLAVFLRNDEESLRFFHEALREESGTVCEWCWVCHAPNTCSPLDENFCVTCGIEGLCLSCLYSPRPNQNVPILFTPRRGLEFVKMCFQCGEEHGCALDIPDARLTERKMQVHDQSRMAMDALLARVERRGYIGLRILAFTGWALCRTARLAKKQDKALAPYLTYVEEARLRIAVGSRSLFA